MSKGSRGECEIGALSKYAHDAVVAVEKNIRFLAQDMASRAEASNTEEGRAAAKALRSLSLAVRRGDHFLTSWDKKK